MGGELAKQLKCLYRCFKAGSTARNTCTLLQHKNTTGEHDHVNNILTLCVIHSSQLSVEKKTTVQAVCCNIKTPQVNMTTRMILMLCVIHSNQLYVEKKTVQHFIQLKQLLLTVSSGWTDVEGNLPSNLYSTFFFSFTKTGLQKEMFFHYPTRKPAIS